MNISIGCGWIVLSYSAPNQWLILFYSAGQKKGSEINRLHKFRWAYAKVTFSGCNDYMGL